MVARRKVLPQVRKRPAPAARAVSEWRASVVSRRAQGRAARSWEPGLRGRLRGGNVKRNRTTVSLFSPESIQAKRTLATPAARIKDSKRPRASKKRPGLVLVVAAASLRGKNYLPTLCRRLSCRIALQLGAIRSPSKLCGDGSSCCQPLIR
jgi:hypothetical protein